MDQLKRLLETLSWKQILSLVLAAAGVIGGLTVFSHWNRERDFRPLYSELSAEDAAAVLAKVRESGSDFRLSDNGTVVLVPSARVAELRLQLAAAGVPKSGRIGYELFDKSNFGASDFSEQVNYHRALEGELERSVMALAEVEQARVHITFPKDSIFLDSREPAKASVLVKLRPGAQLSAQNVAAICQLTASAVEGLAPEAVSVVDMRGNLLNRARRPSSPDDPEPSEAALDYKQKIEHDLLVKINNTLDPLLGADKFRATASVDCDLTSAEQNEETYDPGKSVMVSSQKTEDISGGAIASGVPGTASNLPRPTSRPTTGGNAVTRRSENISYQSSHTERHVRLPQGAVKRVSVALLVDSDVRWEGSGAKARRIVSPPPSEKLKTIHDLVAGVIGFTPERGDQLVVETLPFESTLNPPAMTDAPKTAPPVSQPAWMDQLLKSKFFVAGVGVGLAVFAALLFAVIRLVRGPRGPRAEIEGPQQIPGGSPENLQKQIENQLAEQTALRQKQELEALNALKLPPVTKKTEVLTKHIAEQAKKDTASMAHVLRAWMAESGDERR
ncbi:MAG TPA: flagellar basal-body MS-ring/collar protein FliF [Bryobacteraceae bacterium]|nr:flagellar basal-body MS-ring/collar protein FliF [Bryobacteraceae bacterium]